jgi:hypothetical protein
MNRVMTPAARAGRGHPDAVNGVRMKVQFLTIVDLPTVGLVRVHAPEE